MNEMKKISREDEAADAPLHDRAPDAAIAAPADGMVDETAVITRRNPKRIVLLLAVPLLILLVGGWFWLNSGKTVGTDNAYVKQRSEERRVGKECW